MRRYIIYISVLFFLVGSTHLPSYAIVQDEADNSFYAVAGMEENIDKVNSLLGLSQYYRDIDKDSALMCCDMALELSKRLEYFEGIAGSHYKKSLIYKNSGNYIAARECANKTLGIAEALQDSMLLAKTNYHLGNIIKNLSNNKPALNHYSKALSIYINKKDTLRLTAVYNGFGNYFLERGIYNFAATYYHKALQFAKVVDQEQSQGKILNNLGTVYFELGEYDHSRKYLDASSEIAWKYSDNGEKANILTRLGNLELNLKNFTKAYENYYLADSLFRIDDEAEGIHNTYINFGFLFLEQGKPKKALKNFDIALAYYNEQDLAKGKTAAWQGKAEAYSKLGNNETALLYYDSCLYIAKKTNKLSRQAQIYKDQYKIYHDEGDFEKALTSYIHLSNVEDTIYDLVRTQMTFELDMLYENEKTDQIISRLKDDKHKRTRQRNAFIYTGLGILLLATYLLFFFHYRARKNQVIAAQKIKRLEEEKKLLAARFLVEGQENERKRIATEIHDSLGVLLSTSKMHISAIKDDSPENKALIDKATKFLDEASGEMRKISHNMMPGLLSKLGLCEALEDLFDTLNDSEGIDARMEVIGAQKRLPENKEIMIYRVIQEMVNNTLKHAKAVKINLTIIVHPDQLNISYSDDGKGFDVNKILGQKTMGVQSIRSRVKFLDGIIKIDSSPGNGTVYRISVPLDPDGALTSV